MFVPIHSARRFTNCLLKWHLQENDRNMPWKGICDPYKIWLSEIILQQTRVEQGTNYYNKFITRFPNIRTLYNAPETEVFKLWEGLGYYSRCRNLLKTAKLICEKFNGRFPETYHELLSLPGIGPYTAAAIASFAFELPEAVVDGNVFRVLSRYFSIEEDIDGVNGKKIFKKVAQQLIGYAQPSLFNQALMDLGATICKPALAHCAKCPLNRSCKSYKNDRIYEFPFRSKILKLKNRYFLYLILNRKNETIITERLKKDIWQNLWEPICHEVEQNQLNDPAFISQWIQENYQDYMSGIAQTSEVSVQKLSHQKIHARFVQIDLRKFPSKPFGIRVKVSDLKKYPFPKIVLEHFRENEYI